MGALQALVFFGPVLLVLMFFEVKIWKMKMPLLKAKRSQWRRQARMQRRVERGKTSEQYTFSFQHFNVENKEVWTTISLKERYTKQ